VKTLSPRVKDKSNIVLVGMPGAGKSTVGVLLAKRLSLEFLDTDVAIQRQEGRTLQEIIDERGVDAFRALEERYITRLECTRTVVATGGSVIYSDASMRRLAAAGVVVYLDVPIAELEKRVTNFATRGLVRRREQSLQDLYRERLPLYRAWAEVTVECAALPHDAVVDRALAALTC
jgi:shikimate kinase